MRSVLYELLIRALVLKAMPKDNKSTKASNPFCGMCGNVLVPGIAHVCPNLLGGSSTSKSQNVDWLKWIAFIVQFFVLFGTIMWKASALQSDLQYMKNQQDKDEKSLENIQRYFQKPYDNGGH